MADIYDVLIIGSGAVGCAVAREMALLGQKCILLEKNLDVISEASSGNTGHLVRITMKMISRKNFGPFISEGKKFILL